ncbi:hypothetical protein N0V84_008196 [Fusarium piperis]|uniref:Uncharacterized protein n=1 Tax=Fusarium piperis TaxID=1435070 RepID=A0A9W8W8K5_9HYPO|nr:hypothetical protein N0V84_008196 [Fusarium piperis]
MAQSQPKVDTETDDDEIIGHADQPAPKGPMPDVLEHDFVFKRGLQTVRRVDELIVKVDIKANEHIKGAEDLRDRLVEAKKPIIELLNQIRKNGPLVQEEGIAQLQDRLSYWNAVGHLIWDAEIEV